MGYSVGLETQGPTERVHDPGLEQGQRPPLVRAIHARQEMTPHRDHVPVLGPRTRLLPVGMWHGLGRKEGVDHEREEAMQQVKARGKERQPGRPRSTPTPSGYERIQLTLS